MDERHWRILMDDSWDTWEILQWHPVGPGMMHSKHVEVIQGIRLVTSEKLPKNPLRSRCFFIFRNLTN